MIVLWRVATDCNLACGFCAYDRRLPFARSRVPLAEIERVGRVLADFQQQTGESVLLSWLGGEPLAWPGLLDLSLRLQHDGGMRISATTNGTTLGREAVRATVLTAFDEITVSVDAIGAAHERLRGWPGGWRRLEDAVRALVAQRGASRTPRLRANTVLMRGNVAAFPELCDTLADWGVDEITFNQLGGRDRPEFHRAEALRPDDIDRLRADIARLRPALAARGVRLCGTDAYLERFEASAFARPLNVDACRLPERMLFIDEHCRIAPCSFTVEAYGQSTHTLRTAADLQRLQEAFMARQASTPAAPCIDCHSTQLFAKFAT